MSQVARRRLVHAVACVAGLLVAVVQVGPQHAGAQGIAGVGAPPGATRVARGSVVTDTLWSQALGARKRLVVYLPPSYGTDAARRYPVAYYLHGALGDEGNWTRRANLDQVMDSLVAAGMPEMIVAMPDGDPYSFYTTYNVLLDAAGCRRLMLPESADAEWDCVPWPHYDDYIAYDVVRHVDGRYRTVPARDQRAIAGLSMGGYGAIMLALRYPQTFAAAASHSGVLSPLEWAPPPVGRPLARAQADSARFAQLLGEMAPRFRVIFGADSASWHARDPATLAAQLIASGQPMPALFADCGTDDQYLPQSRAFVAALAARGVSVAYREWPGRHTWSYWRAHVGESLSWIANQVAAPRASPGPR